MRSNFPCSAGIKFHGHTNPERSPTKLLLKKDLKTFSIRSQTCLQFCQAFVFNKLSELLQPRHFQSHQHFEPPPARENLIEAFSTTSRSDLKALQTSSCIQQLLITRKSNKLGNSIVTPSPKPPQMLLN